MSRVILVHGWEGKPEYNWLPWLVSELRSRGHEVIVPAMPNTSEPVINAWVEHLDSVVGELNTNIFFIGHSIGCQTIMRYLEKQTSACGGVLFVAGWFRLTNLEEGTEHIAEPWLTTSIDFTKVKKNAEKFIALFSDDDPYVPVSDAKLFEERLGAKTAVEHGHEHYTKRKELRILPLALQLLDSPQQL